jgi:hypothetical protein
MKALPNRKIARMQGFGQCDCGTNEQCLSMLTVLRKYLHNLRQYPALPLTWLLQSLSKLVRVDLATASCNPFSSLDKSRTSHCKSFDLGIPPAISKFQVLASHNPQMITHQRSSLGS